MAKREVIDYVLLASGYPEDLTKLVKNYICGEFDYEPYGTPFSATFDDGSVGFYQAVVKYGELLK